MNERGIEFCIFRDRRWVRGFYQHKVSFLIFLIIFSKREGRTDAKLLCSDPAGILPLRLDFRRLLLSQELC